MTIRPIEQIIRPQPTVEGAGVHLIRSIGTRQLTNLDPFLLLDHFESSTPADYRALKERPCLDDALAPACGRALREMRKRLGLDADGNPLAAK